MKELTHVDERGVKMVEVGHKKEVFRRAVARGRIRLRPETIELIKAGKTKKGNVIATAQIAGILAVKKTPELIPLCHPIPLTGVDVSFEFGEDYIEATCEVRATYKTGVEMEALTGVTVALLTIWDMVKAVEKDENGQYPFTRIEDVHVVEKMKGEWAHSLQ
ncbi:cyclic pyranopterin monophosphate synthase MoaC [Thermococcus sp. ES12]|uniref:cyclic pyranopterin monophosphate synthase MoaC n=1 Tax=Thermococcus sp. ES12 TaxID=1638246 RepID=UPI00143067D3|nr:cyclic pyranopterin monophosphate synthase MoaC [Thermococcus sp. ES12]NJE76026.1 cyclic pyranopterin monophosphate synthase MoaC [Thermococcus sp. ES12]